MSENSFDSITIPTYIINLKSRPDRLKHILSQFVAKPEFDTHVIEACTHEIGAVGLWKTVRKIVKTAKENEDDVIIIVEDDHIFTEHYDRDFLIKNILEAAEQGCDILSGGIGGGFSHAVPINKNRYWINHFWCTQFIVVYAKFFEQILEANFKDTDTADDFLSELTANKMVLYPFISIQKDFGYSDVTRSNNELAGNITQHFKSADERLAIYQKVYEAYIEKQNHHAKDNCLDSATKR